MHDTALLNGKRFFDTYVASLEQATVIDIGAQNVNGSLKDVCPTDALYLGVDFVAGKGVDVILDDPYKMPFDDESADVVVSSSCFEHSEMFWVLYLEILRILKPHGLFYLNAPSNGSFHRYPVDCYRFYPDSGNALAKWGRLNSFSVVVLEQYTSHQLLEHWNDYVCIFLKDHGFLDRYPNRIIGSFNNFSNGSTYPNLEEFHNKSASTEDQGSLGWRLQKSIKRAFLTYIKTH